MRNLKNVRVGLVSGMRIVPVLAIIFLVACAPQGSQSSPELAAMSERWEEGINSGDIDLLVEHVYPGLPGHAAQRPDGAGK